MVHWFMDFSDNKTSNKRGYSYIIVVIDKFSRSIWSTTLKTKSSKTITDEFSNTLTTSKRSAV